MELLDHLGINYNGGEHQISLKNWIQGVVSLLLLFLFILSYQAVAVFATCLASVFPDTASLIRNRFGNRFWDLGLCLMVCIFKILGDEMNPYPAVVISNHASLADCFVMHHLSRISTAQDGDSFVGYHNQSLNLPIVNFFSWFLVWRVPTIKILLNLLKSDENWELEEKSILFVFARLLRSKFSEWIMLFPEVNIWTQESFDLQRQIGEKYCLPRLEHLLYPRYSAFYNVITALQRYKPHPYSNLYDLTILYSRETIDGKVDYTPPTLLQVFSSETPITILVYIKVRSIARIPQKRKKLERYLEHLWKHKDKIITQIKNENTLYHTRRLDESFASSLVANTSRSSAR
ncbi:hypothetical protein KGF56_004355 [Candida oxycetoniae]|uniref:Phospholipid/glycerol acyltransferase domain-containing protein n=1 Tax=Candida oxycetoniae TaxID=497107 RepID=A0AAI9SUS3_9ASCO|nr:uncharacterized protein KGF56_004355 [Candida oxycetoniae]KAI3402894.1 hypothetical protein KGF56_004355 [Candida oxycetoniae]